MTESTATPWPVVLPNDDGIRPAGNPDECLYCQQKNGQPHKKDCVAVHRRVFVRYSYEIEIEVPAFWTARDIEFHRNESSWCADNTIDDVKKFMDKRESKGGCLCGAFQAAYLRETDCKPYASESDTSNRKDETIMSKTNNQFRADKLLADNLPRLRREAAKVKADYDKITLAGEDEIAKLEATIDAAGDVADTAQRAVYEAGTAATRCLDAVDRGVMPESQLPKEALAIRKLKVAELVQTLDKVISDAQIILAKITP